MGSSLEPWDSDSSQQHKVHFGSLHPQNLPSFVILQFPSFPLPFPLTGHHLLINVCPLQPSQCCCCVHPPSIPLPLVFSERRWGRREVAEQQEEEEESAASAPCFTLHHRSAAHPLNEIKEQMTLFSLCLFTAVNTHTFDGRSHENRSPRTSATMM